MSRRPRLLLAGAALDSVVGLLIEVPVMLLVVHIVNGTQGWYEASRPRGDVR